MLKSIVSIVILTISFWTNVSAQSLNNLQQTLNGISQKYSATIGFSALDLEEGKIYSLNGDKHLPMQSVYKFHLALAVLSQVDQGKFNLDQKIHIKKNDLLPNTHSPLKDKYPNGDVSISLSDLLAYTVGQSDNNGCDILFRLLGGPAKVNSFIHVLGIQNVAIVATEEEMHRDEKV
jgi:beta-lactamase class A